MIDGFTIIMVRVIIIQYCLIPRIVSYLKLH